MQWRAEPVVPYSLLPSVLLSLLISFGPMPAAAAGDRCEPLGGVVGARDLVFDDRAEQPMRLLVSVRAEGAPGGLWAYSLATDASVEPRLLEDRFEGACPLRPEGLTIALAADGRPDLLYLVQRSLRDDHSPKAGCDLRVDGDIRLDRILAFRLEGDALVYERGYSRAENSIRSPLDVAAGRNGWLYVTHESIVGTLDRQLTFLPSLNIDYWDGESWSSAWAPRAPSGIAVDGDRLYVGSAASTTLYRMKLEDDGTPKVGTSSIPLDGSVRHLVWSPSRGRLYATTAALPASYDVLRILPTDTVKTRVYSLLPDDGTYEEILSSREVVGHFGNAAMRHGDAIYVASPQSEGLLRCPMSSVVADRERTLERAIQRYDKTWSEFEAMPGVDIEDIERLYGPEGRGEYAFTRSGGERPELGLALSGGGVRSASFSIGVLKGLEEVRAPAGAARGSMLDRVNVLSTVSGGSYAAYWFYSQQLELDRFCNDGGESRAELKQKHHKNLGAMRAIDDAYRSSCTSNAEAFDFSQAIFSTQWDFSDPTRPLSDYRIQNSLENRSNIISQAGYRSFLNTTTKMTFTMLSQVVSIPFTLAFNGVMDWDLNLKPLSIYYRSQLDRIYGFSPVDWRNDIFLNDRRWFITEHDASPWPFRRFRSRDYSFEDLSLLAKDGHVPFWIVNTRGVSGVATKVWTEVPFLPPVRRMRDLQKLEASVATANYEFTLIQHGSNLFDYHDYDQFLAMNPDSVSQAVNASGAAVDGVAVGGATAMMMDFFNLNLGRYISNPSRGRARKWFHRVLPFPLYSIDDMLSGADAQTIYITDGGHVENLGAYSLVRRVITKLILVDGEHDPTTAFSSLKKLRDALRRDLELDLVLDTSGMERDDMRFDVNDPPFAYLRGCIHGARSGEEPIPIRVLYFKLSMDREQPGKAGEGGMLGQPDDYLPDYHPHVTNRRDESREFPQVSTSDISFSREQFLAYRRLGYDLVKEAEKQHAFEWLYGNHPKESQRACPTRDAGG